jgi:hypothetical protein
MAALPRDRLLRRLAEIRVADVADHADDFVRLEPASRWSRTEGCPTALSLGNA